MRGLPGQPPSIERTLQPLGIAIPIRYHGFLRSPGSDPWSESKDFGVGSVVPHARADVGALATQARGNVLYGPQGLGLLESGMAPAEAIERLLADDPLAAQRQVGMVSADVRAATQTGDETLLKRCSVMPETGLGIDPAQLETLLEDADFRKVRDALPGDDDVQGAAAAEDAAPAEVAE